MNTFPLEFSRHIIFCVISAVFFLIQFFRQGFKYQLLTALAVSSTLLLYINDSAAWRNTVGIIEAVLILAIFILMAIERKKAAAKKEETADGTVPAAGEKEETAGSTVPAAENKHGN